jgi:D-glycero-D-manno-heptose 1,7-bisphosphate phosphatase
VTPGPRGALFLDRDGVLNAKAPEGAYVTSVDDLAVLPGVPEALGALRAAVPGLRIAVVTNQRGVARGRMTEADLARIHAALRARLAAAGGDVDRIEVCPHEGDACDCRKPGVGLFQRVASAWPDLDPAACALVGDSVSDLVAGRRFGARTYLVGERGRRLAEGGLARAQGAAPDEEADSLPALVADGRLVAWLRDGAIVAPRTTTMMVGGTA